MRRPLRSREVERSPDHWYYLTCLYSRNVRVSPDDSCYETEKAHGKCTACTERQWVVLDWEQASRGKSCI